MTPLISKPCDALTGEAVVPGDKSISHRAVLFGGLTVGETRIEGLLEGEDVKRTLAAMTALGCQAEQQGPGAWTVSGCGIGGLRPADDVLDMGNSGTAARLLLGILATHPFTSFLTGDHSLRGRPMARVTAPLSQFGASFVASPGDRLPLAVTGPATAMPISYTLPVASAQVKSAVLLAGLNAPGQTTVIEPAATRDHTERMLTHFGGDIRIAEIDPADGGGRAITVTGQPELTPAPIAVPADISSAAFPLVAALILPGSQISLPAVGMNPGRTGLIVTLKEMGADIDVANERVEGGEPVADLTVRASALHGIDVPAERAPSMIDEYPILAMAAACAEGRTAMHGLAELRVKESDRLGAVTAGLEACGINVSEGEDSLEITGVVGRPKGGATVASHYDHRIAMSFLVLGMASEEPVAVDDASAILTSFPGFETLMNGLGGKISEKIDS
jgi:3-phosphoshikimate 1-carboxyvinyltransferase